MKTSVLMLASACESRFFGKLTVCLGLLFLLFNCNTSEDTYTPPTQSILSDELISYLTSQSKYGLELYNKDGSLKIPRASNGNTITYASNIYDWTVGFYPGSLWQLFEITKDPLFKEAAINYTWSLKPLENYSGTHDLGFMINNSFGKAYAITKEDKYREVLIKGANNLASRYNPAVKCIRSWQGWSFPVIIDNMMNLEMLFDASILTGNTSYYDIAVAHATTTMNTHYRSDYSCYHVIDFDGSTGEVLLRVTHQGISDDSDWARGQAWGLYGFVMCYRFTNNTAFLEHAEKIASFLLEHPNMTADLIPYWDLKHPAIPNTLKDASAAAIMASAFAELYTHTNKTIYKQSAIKIVNALKQNEYLSDYEANHGFMLKHSVGNFPQNSEIDVSINYADYYFLEALIRLEDLN